MRDNTFDRISRYLFIFYSQFDHVARTWSVSDVHLLLPFCFSLSAKHSN